MVRLLLAAGADPAHADDFGVSPLHKAAAFAHPLILSQLLRTGKYVSIYTPSPHLSNHPPTHPYDTGKVSVDIKTGDIRAPPQYEAKTLHQTPLHLALRPSAHITHDQRLDIVVLLLGFGASCLVPDIHGDTPLHAAARLGDPRILWHMLAHAGGAGVRIKNEKGETPVECLDWKSVYLTPLFWVAGAWK